jgi:hypothetical protein
MAQQAELQSVITHLEEFSSQVQDSLATADWSTKRDLIRMLVKKVEICREDVRIAFRVMPVPFDISLGRGDSSPNRGNWQHCWRRQWSSLWRPFMSFDAHTVPHHPRFQEPADDP